MKNILLLTIVLLFTNSLLVAEESDWYIGGSIGKGGNVHFESDLIAGSSWGPYDADLGLNLGFFVGYDVFKFLALEYEADVNLPHTTEGIPSVFEGIPNGEMNIYTVSQYVNLVGKWTFFDKHTPFVKAGIGYNTLYNKYRYNTEYGATNLMAGGIGYHLGVGYDYSFNNHNSLGFSLDKYLTDKEGSGIQGVRDTYTFNYTEFKIRYKYNF